MTCRRYTDTPEDLRFLAGRLRAGELVAVPTETVYGLAADARNEDACRDIFRVKGRPADDPLIVHLPADYNPAEIVRPTALLDRLRTAFWPGPLTVVLEKTAAIPDIVTAGLSSVAVRMPAHPTFQALLHEFGGPLAAPSANPFSGISPTTAEHVEDGLGTRIAHILDGGPCRVGIESTIIDIRDPARPLLLRPGAVPVEEIERTLGLPVACPGDHERVAATAPGQFPRHYSPRTPLVLHPAPLEIPPDAATGQHAFLFFRKPDPPVAEYGNVFWLTDSGNLDDAAAHLFARLREIDRGGFAEIHAEPAPDTGLGRAINDRLRRAAE